MKSNGIWSVIVAYNPKPRSIEQLLDSIRHTAFIIVDNSRVNLGYAAGANRGIRNAFSKAAEWIIVLNQDIELSKETFKKFCDKLKKAPPGIVGQFVGSFDPKRWTTLLPAKNTVDYISGSCMAIHREVIRSVGNFYEPYFMYYEDADLSVRARSAGFPLVHLPLDIRHKERWDEYYLARNHLLFVERNAPITVKLRESLRLPKTLWEHWKKNEWGAIDGVKDYCFRRFGKNDRL